MPDLSSPTKQGQRLGINSFEDKFHEDNIFTQRFYEADLTPERHTHYEVKRKYDPEDANALPFSMLPNDIPYLFRSYFDRTHAGYTRESAMSPMRRRFPPPLKVVEEIFKAVDGYFFRYMLIKNGVTVCFKVMQQPGLRGWTGYHKHNHTPYIVLGTANDRGVTPYAKLLDLCGTLLHECCHAVQMLLVCPCVYPDPAYKQITGKGGHGSTWVELSQAVVNRVRQSRTLKHMGHDHVMYHCVRDEVQGPPEISPN
ncbi:MAG: hypothetical protein M1814_000815 [Vezdaea aestivalis]|nr:MAG: hypothetical protein M1814_000815 [Vezdaea aestivalis]